MIKVTRPQFGHLVELVEGKVTLNGPTINSAFP
jgi:hypothetical protein